MTARGRRALVVGSGHNGLVCATFLARAGYHTTVLERMDRPGGLAATVDVHEGFSLPGLLHESGGVRRGIAKALGLAAHGLAFEDEPSPRLLTHPEHKGLVMHADPARCSEELSARAPGDYEGYVAYRAFLDKVGGFVRGVLDEVPPRLGPDGLGDYLAYAKRGLALRALGQRDMIELLRVAPMCVADWLQEQFTSPLLCAGLAAPALQSTFLGPWSAGTAALLLQQEAARGAGVIGGPAAFVAALASAFEAAGGRLRTRTRVKQILVKGGRACGVLLEDGSELAADVVACACDPKTALLELVDPAQLPFEVSEPLRHVRARGTSAKVHLALDGALVFKGREEQRIARALTGTSIDDLERAFDAVKYRRLPQRPLLDVWVPSAAQQGLAPAGQDVVSLLVHFVPEDLEGGWTEEQRSRLADAALSVLEEVAPGTKARVVARQVLAPPDLQERYGLAGGHLTHGEHALDQLWFMRPTPALARYQTPIAGVYLCGSGSHPGGGVTGQPGALCARTILRAR